MQTIEDNKAFPYIAWVTVLLFSLFTYSLVLQLQDNMRDLEVKTHMNVDALEQGV